MPLKLEILLLKENSTMGNNNLGKSIKSIFDGQYKYIVPLYQRNFAWRKDEIEQLLQDVYEAFKRDKESYYYIGSLVVLKRANGDFEVIDGQQRLTTLSLITKILGINEEPRLFYDSRPEVEEFFRIFYKSIDATCDIDYPQIFYLKNAIDYIKETTLDATGKSNIKITDKDFINYFANNVILVRVEIPQDTDVASYFEIMNNRGVQLQKHEILKSLLIAKLENETEQKEFAKIWNACSQMDIPIQRLFNADIRRKYFGNLYDNFVWPFENTDNSTENTVKNESFCIEDILQGRHINGQSNNEEYEDNEIEEDVSEYKSIIDFPNFLMHVFKLKYQTDQIDIPLNEKELLHIYEKIKEEIDSKDFIKALFFSRVVFDRYIVKTITDKNVEDEIKWTLRKPTKYLNSWKYNNTFGDALKQSRIEKALSMLQITFRTRIYKNWLQDILNWFYNEKKNINVEANEYVEKLDALILQYYDERKIEKEPLAENECVTKGNSYSLGTDTPHFIFNFVDYLYWVENQNTNKHNIEYSADIKDFDFKYWNSVEHHMAREWAERNNVANKDEFIDNLGNLCLISRSSNSRLSDRDVKEKVETFGNGNLGANRQIMYAMTKNPDNTYTWVESKIKTHYNDLLDLLSKREEILKNKQSVIPEQQIQLQEI